MLSLFASPMHNAFLGVLLQKENWISKQTKNRAKIYEQYIDTKLQSKRKIEKIIIDAEEGETESS